MKLYLSVIIIILLSCSENKIDQQVNTEQDFAYSIPKATPSEFNLNDSLLVDLTNRINSQYYPNIHSVLIAKDGKLIYEEYFAGQDYDYGTDLGVVLHSDTTLHDVRSISKSIVSALVGIAIQKGYIESVEQKISTFFPEYASLFRDQKGDWKIHDFLTMTTGLDWNEQVPYSNPENDEYQLFYAEESINYIFSKELIEAEVYPFNYNGGATQVLARIVEKASQSSIEEFARAHLFDPLGINTFVWKKYPGSGEVAAASGLRLSSRDLMKIGLLYRNKGQWKGNQLLSEQWVEDSFSKQVAFPSTVIDGNDYYGYQFWIWDENIQGNEFLMVSATGNGDQHIYWDRKNDLIIVTTAGNYNQWDIPNNSYALYRNEIYPIFVFNKD